MERSKRSWIRRSLAAISAAAVLGLTACGGQGSPADGDHVRVGLTGDYATLDFQTRATPTIIGYSLPGYDRLIAYSADKSELVPYLATDWELTPADSPTSITFTLRDDAVCPGGDPITPAVVQASMERFLSVEKVANRLPNLFGPGPYESSIDEDAGTFTFSIGEPNVNLAYGFAQTGIICPEGLAALDEDPDALTKQQYGSGPYSMVSAQADVGVTWEKRDEWSWGPEGSSLEQLPDTLTYQVVTDPTTLTNLVTTGALDFGAVEGPDVGRVRENDSLAVKTADNHMGQYLLFNQNPERVTVDPTVREALMAAIDNDKALAAAGGFGTASATIIHPNASCHLNDADRYLPAQRGPEAARSILEAADKLGTPINLVVGTNTGGLAEYLSGEYRAAGFDVTLDNLSFGENATRYVQQDFDVIVANSINYDLAQGANLQLYYGEAPPNGSNTGNIGGGDPKWNEAGRLSTQLADCAPLEDLQRLALERNYMLPLYFATTYAVGSDEWDFPPVLDRMEFLWLKKTE